MRDKKIFTFEDLVFKTHPTIGAPAVSASLDFKNGGWISVVGGSSYLHGDGKNTFEVMSSETNGDVLSYLTREEVENEMLKLQLSVF
jgi:hypothetical protein